MLTLRQIHSYLSRLEVVSTDHKVLVYKVDYSVQSSLSSSLVLTLIQGSFSWSTLRSWVCNSLCIKIENLWFALYSLFNTTQDCQIDIDVIDKISNKWLLKWISFSEKEFTSSIIKCNNLLTPEPDKLSWRHLKRIVKNKSCLKSIINIADVCFELGHWPFHFKVFISIIIPKPNKELYDSLKSFKPIVLLNTIEKLIKKW